MSEWVSVEDKLPKENGTYIVYAQDKNSPDGVGIWYENKVTTADYDVDLICWWWNERSNDYDITDIVTHWMPLPEPPRMEGE